MSLFSNIKGLFGLRKKAVGALSAPTLGLVNRLFGQNWNDRAYLEAYGKSLYVYACVSKIAEKVGSIDFSLYRIINSSGDVEEIKNHPILDLLYRVNPFYTKSEFLETDVINRKLTGDSFILKIRNNSGQVAELWNIRPDFVTIYPDKEKYISHYEILTADGQKMRVEPEDMIHIKYPSPLEMYFGMSPLSSAKNRVDTEEYASLYQRDFFLNNARPDAVIELEGYPTETQRKEIKDGWELRHKGIGKNSKIGVLWGGAKYNQISLSQKEMDFIESMRFTRDDILVAFKVPKPIIAITDDVNRANAETALDIFLSETVIPEVKRFVDKINEQLITPDFGPEYLLTFEDPVPVNREMRLKELNLGIDRWVTINEARREAGLEPIEGGDSLYRPMTMQPIGSIQQTDEEKGFKNLRGKMGLRLKLKMKEELREELIKVKNAVKNEVVKELNKDFVLKKGIKENSLFTDTERRKQYWDYRTKDIEKKSKRLRALVIKTTNQQKEEFLKRFRKEQPKTKQEIRKLFNRKEQNQLFKETFLPLFLSIFKESGEDAMQLISIDKPFDIEKATGPRILDLLIKRATFFANAINNTTLTRLTETLAEGIAAGEGIKKLEDRILEVYDEFSDYRATLIARTETNAVVNEAHLEAYNQSEIVEGKEWVGTLDDRIRDEHLMMDGEQVELDQPFSNGLMYPSEPNCRCTTAPVIHLL